MTTLMRWAPANGLSAWDESVRDLFRGFGSTDEPAWIPDADVVETRDAYDVTLDAPGVTAGDLKLSVEDGVLRVQGFRRAAPTDESRVYLAERSFGSFDRAFRLPGTVDPEQVKAALKDGVLTITLPKRAEAKSRRIEIATV